MLAIFARDAALIRNWLGRIERLSALRPQAKGTGSDDEWSGLSVQMTDAVGRVAQWTLWRDDNAVESGRAAEFVMQGTKGRLVAQPTAARPFHLILRETPAESISQSIPAGEETDAASREDDDEAGTLLKLLANANHAEQVWENACRAVELAETIEISARRSKTIQLFHEELLVIMVIP